MKTEPVSADISREIPRLGDAPALSPQARDLLTDLCFGERQDPLVDPCDALFIFGVSQTGNQLICKKMFPLILQTVRPKTIYITGGITDTPRPEAEMIRDLIDPRGYPHVLFKIESKSLSTLSNVKGALDLGLASHSNIVFLSQWGHCGRCRLTLLKYLPHATIRPRGYASYPPAGPDKVGRIEWFDDPYHRALIWGEFLRIELYGSRGDIAYPEDIRAKVARIRELTAPMPPA